MGVLILVRHGESIWNLENRFTGWVDISLSKKGIQEAKKAGKLLSNYNFDIAFTSRLFRAQHTLFYILDINKQCNKYLMIHDRKIYNRFTKRKEDKDLLYIYYSEALNERNYGDLQGLNKEETRQKFSSEQVYKWRRSFDIAPPKGESLKDTMKRTLPYFKSKIFTEIKKGNTVLIAAHGNSLRAIVKFVENISDESIPHLELETGVPYVYEFDKEGKLKSKKILK